MATYNSEEKRKGEKERLDESYECVGTSREEDGGEEERREKEERQIQRAK